MNCRTNVGQAFPFQMGEIRRKKGVSGSQQVQNLAKKIPLALEAQALSSLAQCFTFQNHCGVGVSTTLKSLLVIPTPQPCRMIPPLQLQVEAIQPIESRAVALMMSDSSPRSSFPLLEEQCMFESEQLYPLVLSNPSLSAFLHFAQSPSSLSRQCIC